MAPRTNFRPDKNQRYQPIEKDQHLILFVEFAQWNVGYTSKRRKLNSERTRTFQNAGLKKIFLNGGN